MKIHNLGYVPDGYEYSYGQISEFDSWDIEHIEKINPPIDEIWYWYAQGDYEGSGEILLRRGGEYFIASASHCSCYGPCENISVENPLSLDELLGNCSEDYQKSILPLVKWAKSGRKPKQKVK